MEVSTKSKIRTLAGIDNGAVMLQGEGMNRLLRPAGAFLIVAGIGCIVYAVSRSMVVGESYGAKFWFTAPPDHLGGIASGASICTAGVLIAAIGAAVSVLRLDAVRSPFESPRCRT